MLVIRYKIINIHVLIPNKIPYAAVPDKIYLFSFQTLLTETC